MGFFSNKHITYNKDTPEDIKQKKNHLMGRRMGFKESHPQHYKDNISHEEMDRIHDQDNVKKYGSVEERQKKSMELHKKRLEEERLARNAKAREKRKGSAIQNVLNKQK